MQESQNQAIYWDKHRIPINITVIFSLGVAAFGLFQITQGFQGNISPQILILLGLVVGVYSWLTRPKLYIIYPDSLVIAYGKPRNKVIRFSDVADLDLRQIATPDRLRVLQTNGRRMAVEARDPEAFHEQLKKALDEFRKMYPELAGSYPEELPQEPSEESSHPAPEDNPPGG